MNSLEESANLYFSLSMLVVVGLFVVYLVILKKQNRLTVKNIFPKGLAMDNSSVRVREKKRLSPDTVLYIVEIDRKQITLIESTKSVTMLSEEHFMAMPEEESASANGEEEKHVFSVCQ